MQPVISVRRNSATRPSTPAPDSLEGGRVVDGRYALKRLLATGGGAQLYAAEHRFTRRQVAVKLPLDPTPVGTARVQREIESLARVRGAGVVDMVDAAEIDGRPFIVFELLEGRTLAGLLAARGRLGVDDVVRIGLELTASLERCHSAGVVHRDVKPANLFITTRTDRQLVLLDFGIAMLTDPAGGSERLTRDCTLLGTPEYMAPESLLSSDEADHRVDVYGVGVVLYECLTGAVPFDGNYADVLLKLSTSGPRPIQEHRPEVPADLARVITKCLSRQADDRYATVTALHGALRACASPRVSSVRLLAGLPACPADSGSEAPTLTDSPHARGQANPVSRRKHPRAPYTTLARLTLEDGTRIDGRLEEISEGGLQFHGERAIPMHAVTRIRFGLPASGRIIDVGATARWTRTVRGSNATGFEFHDLADTARDEIRRYVSIMCAEVA